MNKKLLSLLLPIISTTVLAQEKAITISLSGNIMMGTTYPTTMLPDDDGENIFRDTKNHTITADLALANLEGALCDGGITHKTGKNSYAFRMPTRYGKYLKDAGYDFLSMANNHANDFGLSCIESTEEVLDQQGIKYAGIKGRNEYAIIEKDGIKYGITAFGHNNYTLMHTDLTTVKRVLTDLRPQVDILIVSVHGGAEGKSRRNLPYGSETFLGENRGNLRELAKFCIDNGADIIYGHGPHVARAIEVYKNRFIAYSLGNFATPYGMNLSGISGYAPLVNIRINRQGEFIDGVIYSFIQQPSIGPRIDETHSVAQEIKQLTEEDISNNAIDIDQTGHITVKYQSQQNKD
ncbi:MAG: CapA family protein [Neisseriaceae bacterium]|nr:CapA family protein [Neisseriaceae bacterium]